MMPIDGTLVLMLFTTLAGFSFGIRIERERCARIVDERYWDANQSDGHIEGWNGAVKTIAAAIRSGK